MDIFERRAIEKTCLFAGFIPSAILTILKVMNVHLLDKWSWFLILTPFALGCAASTIFLATLMTMKSDKLLNLMDGYLTVVIIMFPVFILNSFAKLFDDGKVAEYGTPLMGVAFVPLIFLLGYILTALAFRCCREEEDDRLVIVKGIIIGISGHLSMFIYSSLIASTNVALDPLFVSTSSILGFPLSIIASNEAFTFSLRGKADYYHHISATIRWGLYFLLASLPMYFFGSCGIFIAVLPLCLLIATGFASHGREELEHMGVYIPPQNTSMRQRNIPNPFCNQPSCYKKSIFTT